MLVHRYWNAMLIILLLQITGFSLPNLHSKAITDTLYALCAVNGKHVSKELGKNE